MTKTLAHVEAEVRRIVDDVRDDPEGRLRLRKAFYRTYGEVEGWPEGFGISELAFMRWELSRGVLDPLTGSAWWRNVNLDYIYWSELAGKLHQLDMDHSVLPLPVRFWIEYFRRPSAVTWYRAHNGSILQGYIQYADQAFKETVPEQKFLNIVLYRVVFTQSLTEDRSCFFSKVAHFIANPLSPSVDILVHVPDFYPDHYPLTEAEIRSVLHRSFTPEGLAAAFFDEVIILPQLARLYRHAARWLQQPMLESFVRDRRPVYPANLVSA